MPSFFDALRRKVGSTSSSKDKEKGSAKSGSELGGIALNATKETLKILKDTVEGVPAPGLQGIIGGILAILDVVDRVKQNAQDFADLNKYLQDLNAFMLQFKDAEFPKSLHKPVEILVKSIADIQLETLQLASHKRWRRIIDNSEDSQTYLTNVSRIGQVLQSFQTQATVAIAIVTEKSAKDISRLLQNAQQYIFDKLPVAEGALYNSWERSAVSGCFKGTRTGVLAEIHHWIFDTDAPCVFWLNGLAGTGKSTIAQSVAELCANSEPSCLAASFFFARDKLVRHSANRFFTTIVHQLATYNANLSPLIVDVLTKNPSLATANLNQQFALLLMKPLQELQRSAPANLRFPMVVVVDALDECTDPDAVTTLLRLILNGCSKSRPPLIKFFITSRPEAHIVAAFHQFKLHSFTQPFILHEVSRDIVQDDIRKFLIGGFQDVRARWQDILRDELQYWPSPADINELVRRSAGLFIYASTILKFVDQDDENPRDRLSMVWRIQTDGGAAVHSSLDQLYQHILGSCPNFERMQTILGTLLLVVNPMSVAELEELLELQSGEVRIVLRRLQSILLVPTEDDRPVRLFHPSFYDFLTSRARAGKYALNRASHQASIARRCIGILHSMRDDDLELSLITPRRRIINYACQHWAHHLSNSEFSGSLLHVVVQFHGRPFDLWLDALDHMFNLPASVSAYASVLFWIQRASSSQDSQAIRELSERLNRLGSSFAEKFRHLGLEEYSSCAATAFETAIRFHPDSPLPQHLYNLGCIRRGPDVIEKALEMLPKDHEDRHVYLHGLGVSLRGRFNIENASFIVNDIHLPEYDIERFEIIPDTDEASKIDTSVLVLEDAVSLVPVHHPNRGPCLNSLAISLQIRSEMTQTKPDLDRAIEIFLQASECAGNGSRNKTVFLNNVGSALRKRFDLHGELTDIRAAMRAFKDAQRYGARTSSPSLRFSVAMSLARCMSALPTGEISSSDMIDAYAHGLQLASMVPWAALRLPARRKAVTDASDFAREAVAAAIEAGYLDRAMEWAEQGNSIFWVDGLFLDSNLKIRRAQGLKFLIQALGRHGRAAEEQDWFEPYPLMSAVIPPEDKNFRSIIKKWEHAVSVAQDTPQIPWFRRAVRFSEMQKLVPEGYVVVLNSTDRRSDAMIVQPRKNVINVTLPAASRAAIHDLAGYIEMPSLREFRKGGSEGVFQDIWNMAVGPIVKAMDPRAGKTLASAELPRLWWCASGPFLQLPLHAAATFEKGRVSMAADFAVHSYIPTLDALRHPQDVDISPRSFLLFTSSLSQPPEANESSDDIFMPMPTVEDGFSGPAQTYVSPQAPDAPAFLWDPKSLPLPPAFTPVNAPVVTDDQHIATPMLRHEIDFLSEQWSPPMPLPSMGLQMVNIDPPDFSSPIGPEFLRETDAWSEDEEEIDPDPKYWEPPIVYTPPGIDVQLRPESDWLPMANAAILRYRQTTLAQLTRAFEDTRGLHVDIPAREIANFPLQSGITLINEERLTVGGLAELESIPPFIYLASEENFWVFPPRFPYDLISAGCRSVIHSQGGMDTSVAQSTLVGRRFYEAFSELGSARALHSALSSMVKEGTASYDLWSLYYHTGV